MSEQSDNLILEHLRGIRAEQSLTNTKIGALAESMTSMRKDIYNLEIKVGSLETRICKLEDAVNGVRADVRMIALAVDEHTHRLDRIEAGRNQG